MKLMELLIGKILSDAHSHKLRERSHIDSSQLLIPPLITTQIQLNENYVKLKNPKF